MKLAVIVFPGSNCDLDLYEALHTVCGADVEYVSHKATSLAGFDGVMIPGGFSYGDYLRAGAIARFAPVMKEVIRLAKAGAPVFGTCNGFQILTEAGLLPGALKKNDSQRFVCKTVALEVPTNTPLMNGSTCRLPMPTAVFTLTKRPWTNWKPTVKSFSAMPKKIPTAV